MATSKALRVAAPKDLNTYIAHVNMTSKGIKSVDDNKFVNFLFESLAPESIATAKVTIPLGFNLEFSHNPGYKYRQCVVTRAGWIALVEDSDASIVADISTGTDIDDNEDIDSTFARNHILLAPWFDSQYSIATTIDQLKAGGAYASLTSDDITKIKQGADNKNYPYDRIDRSVRYLNYYEPNKGRCLLVRWTNSQVYYGKRFKYEVAIFESGKFEFRYWPLVEYTPGDFTPTSSAATVGIFWNGTTAGTSNRFRDFAPLLGYRKDTTRPLSPYGGAAYSVSYSESGLPYSSQVSEKYWPINGAVIHFSPPSNLVKFLPKKLAKNLALSKKIAADPGPWDDRKTVYFSENSTGNVYMPSTLNSRLIGDTGESDVSALQLLIGTGSIVVPGKQNKNIVDGLLKQLDTFEAEKSTDRSFNEHQKNYKSILTSSNFYYNSSSLSFFGNEFDSSLKSKTQFNFSLPVNKTSIMNPTTSSLYYYDADKKGWALIDPDGYRGPESLTIRSTTGEVDNSNYYRITETNRGFDAVGRKVVSGSRGTSLNPTSFPISYQTDNIIGAIVNQTLSESFGQLIVQSALNKSYKNSITDNQKFFPEKTQQVQFQIDEPFLIEKIVVKLPFYAENEWFKDLTTCNRAFGDAMTAEGYASGAIDFGGPGITLSVFCPKKSGNVTYMDLIASGTFTHQLDNKAEVYMEKGNDQYYYSIRPTGFLSFSNPTAVVSGTWNGSSYTFDGKVSLEMEASVAGGITFARNDRSQINTDSDFVNINVRDALKLLTTEKIQTMGETSYNVFDTAVSSAEKYALKSPRIYIQQVSPLARGTSKLEFNGNSILGGNIAYARVERTVKNPLFFDTNAKAVVSSFPEIESDSTFNFDAVSVYSTVDSRPAPYLMLPGDKLTFCISKTRPVTYMAIQTAARGFGYNDYQTYMLTGSHDTVILNTGSLDVTVYGSYVREGAEYHR